MTLFGKFALWNRCVQSCVSQYMMWLCSTGVYNEMKTLLPHSNKQLEQFRELFSRPYLVQPIVFRVLGRGPLTFRLGFRAPPAGHVFLAVIAVSHRFVPG